MKIWCMNDMNWEKDECYLGTNGIVYQVKNARLFPSKRNTHFPIFDERIIKLIDELKKLEKK